MKKLGLQIYEDGFGTLFGRKRGKAKRRAGLSCLDPTMIPW